MGMIRGFAVACGLMVASTGWGVCLEPPGDLDGTGLTNVTDVQCSILMNLWSLQGQTAEVPTCVLAFGSPAVVADHNCDLVINVSDTLAAIQFAIGTGLSAAVDVNGDTCFDACESDLDGDGEFDLSDCAPHDPGVNPEASESCGFDANCDGAWDAGVGSCPAVDACTAPGLCVGPSVGSGLRISEIMFHAVAAGSAVGDWIEVTNTGDAAVNLRQWTLTVGPEVYTIDPGGALFVPPAGAAVIGVSADRTLNGGLFVHAAMEDLVIPDGGTAISLFDADGALADTVAALGAFPYEPGVSSALVGLDANGFDPASWALSSATYGDGDSGTPGGPNRDVMGAVCEVGAPLDCDDGDACTGSSCDPAAGCEFEALGGGPCDDGDPETSNDVCVAGLCQGSTGPCTGDGFCPETSTTVCGTMVVDSLYIPEGVTVSCAPGCTQPVVFVVAGHAVIDGTLSVSGAEGASGTATNSNPFGATGGAGGPGGCGGFGGGKGGNSQSGTGQSGLGSGGGGAGVSLLSVKPWGTFYNGGNAGGGGFATSGTSGFQSSGTGISGGGGSSNGAASLTSFVGGSGGGGGSGGLGGASTGYGGGGGGAGGGAVQVEAQGSVTIGPTGVIEADGGLGAFCQNIGARGAGGAGAGGAIRLTAPAISNDGVVRARGGENCFLNGGAATDGRGGAGRIRLDVGDGTLPAGSFDPAPGWVSPY